MNRRNFIKAFSAISASVPIATSLASIKGTENVIEIFQINDLENEIKSKTSINKDSIIYKQNPNYLIPIFVLAYNYKEFNYFKHNIFKNSAMIHPDKFRYIINGYQLQGIKRKTKIIGLEDYWLNDNFSDIMRIVYEREYQILKPSEYFNWS